MAISAFANASRVLAAEQPAHRSFPIDGRPAADYLDAAEKVRYCIEFVVDPNCVCAGKAQLPDRWPTGRRLPECS